MTSRAPRALVTGASGAIGGAIARRLAAANYEVLITGRDADRLEAIAESIRTAGGRAEGIVADLTKAAGIDRVCSTVGEESLDLLVHSLGAFHFAPIAETSLETLDHLLAVNLRAPWELTRRLDPSRLQDLVFVSTTAVLAPGGGRGAYAASKAALGVLSGTLRDELGDHGVRVLTVFPGRTASAMQEQVREMEGVPYDPEAEMQPDDVAAMVLAAVTLPRSAEVTEIVLRQRRPGAPR